MLQLNDLRLAPESVPVRLQFAKGQIAVVLGRNNSGKTNLLRLIAGLPTRAKGSVSVGDQPLSQLPTGDRPVGFVFQAFVNYPHWNARRNIESPLIAKGVSRTDRQRRVEQIAQTLQIEDLLERLPAELSGGQQQRLAIGRALASDAQVLLLDEPFVNLDFRLRERLTTELAELLRLTGTTVVFASSDARDAFALGDSVALLDQQQVLQTGDPLSVYREPLSLRAADLFSEPGVNWLYSGAHFEVVRPEHMALEPSALSTGFGEPLRYVIRVSAIETNGSHTFVQGELRSPMAANTSPVWVARLTGMPDMTPHIRNDGSLECFVDPRDRMQLGDGGIVHGVA